MSPSITVALTYLALFVNLTMKVKNKCGGKCKDKGKCLNYTTRGDYCKKHAQLNEKWISKIQLCKYCFH